MKHPTWDSLEGIWVAVFWATMLGGLLFSIMAAPA